MVPDSLVTSQSTDYELYPDYNGITLTNDRTGKQAQVKRTGTGADVLLPPENNPLFDVVSMGAFGKAKLAKAGMVETHTLTMPISTEEASALHRKNKISEATFYDEIKQIKQNATNTAIMADATERLNSLTKN